jgi:hypothetical protein
LCDPNFFSVAKMFPKPLYKHLLPALLAGLLLRLFFIWRFPFYSGDTPYYEELARNWLYHGVYSFYSNGQLLPSDARMPGYPAFLAIIYFWAGPARQESRHVGARLRGSRHVRAGRWHCRAPGGWQI